MTKIILLSGRQGAGKTSLSNEILQHLYKKRETLACFQLNFADTIYLMHDKVLEVLKDCGIERDIVKDGPLLQLLGTDWGRKYLGEDIWIKTLRGRMERAKLITPLKDLLVIVGDCRFENEFDAFPEALRVRLVAPGDTRKARCSMWRDNTTHPSEINLDFYDGEGRFDLYLDTATTPVTGCAELVLAQLDKGTWMEKRK